MLTQIRKFPIDNAVICVYGSWDLIAQRLNGKIIHYHYHRPSNDIRLPRKFKKKIFTELRKDVKLNALTNNPGAGLLRQT